MAFRLLKMKIHNDFSDIFTGIGCFKGTLRLQVREGSHPYQSPSRRVAYALPRTIKRRAGKTKKGTNNSTLRC